MRISSAGNGAGFLTVGFADRVELTTAPLAAFSRPRGNRPQRVDRRNHTPVLRGFGLSATHITVAELRPAVNVGRDATNGLGTPPDLSPGSGSWGRSACRGQFGGSPSTHGPSQCRYFNNVRACHRWARAGWGCLTPRSGRCSRKKRLTGAGGATYGRSRGLRRNEHGPRRQSPRCCDRPRIVGAFPPAIQPSARWRR